MKTVCLLSLRQQNKKQLQELSSLTPLKRKPQKGKVIAIGEGLKDKPVTVKVGDQILYGKYSGTEITIDGKEYLIMRNSDIFGTI
jgi:co-chaperonin GroES (HSP10)